MSRIITSRAQAMIKAVESIAARTIVGKQRLLIWGVLLGVFFLGTALRLYQLDADSFWSDEIVTARTSQMSIPSIIHHQHERALNPPLTFIVTHFFFECYGESEFTARLPAALLGMLSVLLIYRVGDTLYTPREGIIAAFLLAVSAHHIKYSQEARPYALMMFLALLSVLFLLKALQKDKLGLWMGFALCTILSLYNHYFAFLLLPAELIFAAWLIADRWLAYRKEKTSVEQTGATRAPANPAKQAFLFSLTVVLVGVSYLPWVSTLGAQVSQQTQPGPLGTSAERLTSSLDFLREALFAYGGGGIIPALFFVTALLLGLTACDRKRIALTLLWMGTPFVFLGTVAVKHPVNLRYVLFTMPAFLLVAARGITYAGQLVERSPQRTERGRAWLAAVFPTLCVIILGLASALSTRTYHLREKEDWRGAARYLAAHMEGGDIVVADGIRYRAGGDSRRVSNALSYYLSYSGAPQTPVLEVGRQLWQDLQSTQGWNGDLWVMLWSPRQLPSVDKVAVIDFHRVYVVRLRRPSGDAVEDTLSMLQALLDLLPPEAHFDVHLALEEIYRGNGRYEEAALELDTASSVKPDDPEASQDLSLARAELQRVYLSAEADLQPIGSNLGGLIALLGYRMDAGDVGAGEPLLITLRWQALAAMDKDYTFFVHLVGPDDRIWAQEDRLLEHGGLLTSAWQVGQVVTNQYELVPGAQIPSGEYAIQAGIYYWETGERLPVLDESGQSLPGDAVVLERLSITD
jgi:mannosyltransferase